jgi:general secretion pathway protein E
VIATRADASGMLRAPPPEAAATANGSVAEAPLHAGAPSADAAEALDAAIVMNASPGVAAIGADEESRARVASPIAPAHVSTRFLDRIPRDFARRHVILSQGHAGSVERLMVSSATSKAAIFNTGVRLGCAVDAVEGDAETIARAIDAAYAARGVRAEAPPAADVAGEASVEALIAAADRDLLATGGKAPLVRLVDSLLFEALTHCASDLHIQPLERATLVRIRLDGMLHDVRELPASLTAAVVSRIKVMGRMDIAERRVPQDGRASVTLGGRAIDLRISTLPTSYGERAVVRLLDTRRSRCDFDGLGMPTAIAGAFLQSANRSHGLILVTGPTGSGKTTTLYATLRRIAHPGLNVLTIEDPIEYELSSIHDADGADAPATPGPKLAISQAQVNPRKGVTFATGLRHILRQDPDVIMVGEIRDAETARIAVQSSLTGHLVFSTLHTNDAPSAVTRLIDLEVEPYLVASSLSAVLAQRLIRLRHEACGGAGCADCGRTGVQGRTGIFELLVLDESLRSLIGPQTSLATLRRAAAERGVRTLREAAMTLVERGRTTIDEVNRVVVEDEG